MLIDRTLDLGLGEPPETYSSSPHVYSDLNIAENVTGRLPRSERTRAGLDAEEIEDIGETGQRSGGGGRSRSGRGRDGGGRGGRGGSGGGRPGRDGGERAGSERAAGGGGQRRRRRRRRTHGGKPAE